MDQTLKFTFPFKGKVKTQLIIAKNRLIKPKNVKQFEFAVRNILMTVFPLEKRPLTGYLKFEMFHYTTYKRNKEGDIEPTALGDLDNLFKTLADCFEPVYKNITALDDNGEMMFTKTGKPKTKKEMVTPGVITNDKKIVKAGLHWVPIENEKEERIELFISPLREEDLFHPNLPKDVVDLTIL